MTRTATRGCDAISRALKMAAGVSTIAQMVISFGAPAASRCFDTSSTSAALLTFGITIDDAHDFAAAAMSAAPHGVSRPLHRMVISRLP